MSKSGDQKDVVGYSVSSAIRSFLQGRKGAQENLKTPIETVILLTQRQDAI
jgi:hypothetical protein